MKDVITLHEVQGSLLDKKLLCHLFRATGISVLTNQAVDPILIIRLIHFSHPHFLASSMTLSEIESFA